MFFFLSKVLSFLVMPFTWAMLLLLISWITKNQARKKKCFISAMVILFLFSNRFIHNQVTMAWEIDAVAEPEARTYDGIIVLGGFSTYNEEFDRINFSCSSDRLMQALQLQKKSVAPFILVTGGSGSITFPEHREGTRVQTYLRKIGIPDSALIIENESKNTYENAVMTAKILKAKKPNGKYLLITSGYHMRRSIGCFAKAGLNCTPYSVDLHGGESRYSLDYFLAPDPGVMADWNTIFHEWIGCITYKMSGYL